MTYEPQPAKAQSQTPKHKNVSVGTRLLLINGLLAISIAIISTIQWQALESQQDASIRIFTLSKAQRANQNADMMHDSIRSHVYASLLKHGMPKTSDTIAGQLRKDASQLRENLIEVAALNLPAFVHKAHEENLALIDRYIEAAVRTADLALTDPVAAKSHLPIFEAAFDEVLLALEAQTDLLHKEASDALAAASAVEKDAKVQIVIAGISVNIFVAFLVGMISLSIRRSLQKVRNVAQTIAAGNLNQRCSHTSNDEVGQLSNAVNSMADNLQDLISRLRKEADRDAFGTQLSDAMEMADTETEAHAVIARAMAAITTEHPIELLLADSSRAHLECAAQHPTRGAPGCGVDSPFSCVAVRRGNPVIFEDSDTLNACPRLRDRPSGSISAVCIPIGFMGHSLGVLHATGERGKVLNNEQIARLTTLGHQTGARIGTVRAFQRTQIQATTDGLTGLVNRRQLEEQVRVLSAENVPYALVMADLDHFKRLNDGYGHETGDKALRLFAEVMRKCSRENDWPGRWGGEEFAIILPKATAQQAYEFVERLRAQTLLSADTPEFTASFGISDSSMGSQFEQIVRLADDALYQSKDSGRNCGTVANPSSSVPIPRRKSGHDAVIDIRGVVHANATAPQ